MFVIEYTFGMGWHSYKELSDMYEAKQTLKALKKRIGKEGKARIRKIGG